MRTWALGLLLLVGGGLVSAAETAPTRVFAGIEPVAWVVREIGGDRVEVETLLPPSAAPETFEPGARHLVRLAGADHLFVIGLPFERQFVERMSSGQEFPPVTDLSLEGATRGDPHLWLDPLRLQVMARVVTDRLVSLQPEAEPLLRARESAFVARMQELDGELGARLAGHEGEVLLTVHPAYGAFTQRYGLRQVALEVDGHSPTARYLAELSAQLRDRGPMPILTQPQHSDRAARVLERELDLRRVEVDPLAADVTAVLRRLAEVVVTGAERETP